MAMADKFIIIGGIGADARISAEIPDERQSIVSDELRHVFGTCSGRRKNVVSRLSCTTGTSNESTINLRKENTL